MVGFSCLALALTAASSVLAALPPITVKGSNFIDSASGQRFAIVGVDYQPGGQAAAGTNNGDPLSNNGACLRDAVMMQKLGVNTLRVYNIDPTLNHDQCMSIFDAAGIYVILDVNTPLSGQYIDRSNPSSTYTLAYLTHIFTVVEAFKNYPNLLGFFAGNEVINDIPTAQDNPPYMRAVQRDLKDYIAKRASRAIPVGYSAADVREILQDTWAYLQCNNGDTSRADFFGLNSYSWCGSTATFQSSGYSDLVTMFASTTIPVFFSEYGCNKVAPRVFDEVQALYGAQMTTLSGGLVYEYSQEEANYGLITINTDASLKLLSDYNSLQSQYTKIDVGLIQAANSTSQNQVAPKCSSSLISGDGFGTNFTIPARPSGAANLINNGVPNAPTAGLVSVTATSVTQTVQQTDGSKISNLVLQVKSGGNTPGSASSSASSGGKTSSSTGAAAAPTAMMGMGGKVGLAAGLLGAAVAVL